MSHVERERERVVKCLILRLYHRKSSISACCVKSHALVCSRHRSLAPPSSRSFIVVRVILLVYTLSPATALPSSTRLGISRINFARL